MYKLKTPNHLYSGVTEGVPFSQGIGYTDDKNIRNVLVNDYGYEDVTEDAEVKEGTAEENEEPETNEKELEDMTLSELKEVAKTKDLSGFSRMTRDELIVFIKENTAQ